MSAVIVHRMPGRMRLRIPGHRRDREYFSRLSDRLEAIDTLTGCEVNAATGSVLLHYEGSEQDLMPQLRECIPSLQIESRQENRPPARAPGPPPRLVSGREISPMFVLGAALATVGLVQTLRGRVAVPSITAFWYALESFRRP